jgi:hypothetical protein
MGALNTEEVRAKLREAHQKYFALKATSKQLRNTYLDNLPEAVATQENFTKGKVIKSLRERERQRDQARKIRYIRGKICSGATTLVTIEENGQMKDVISKKEIENTILTNNKEKFS